MTVKGNREELSKALKVLERATARRENLPVLNGVLIDARNPGTLALTATDLEIGVRTTLPATGDGGWVRVVDARLLSGLVGRLGGESVELTASERHVTVAADGARFQLASIPNAADEFPALPDPENPATISINAATLSTALRRVVYAASDSDQRPVLSGVLFEVSGDTLVLVATDNSRLAYDEIRANAPADRIDGSGRAIIPANAVQEMIRVLESVPGSLTVILRVAERISSLSAGPYRVTMRGIEGTFPPYRQVFVDDPPHVVGFERRPLLDAIGRLALLSRRGPAVVIFEPADEPGMVTLRSAEADVGEGVETLRTVDGPWPAGMRVAYQARFVEEFLRAVESDVVRYAFADPTRQSQWTVAGSGYRYIVMPVRLGDESMARAA